MITRMKKLQCLVYHREYDAFLEQLRQLGVVHVEADKLSDEGNAEMKQSMQAVQRIEKVIGQLKALQTSNSTLQTPHSAQSGREAVDAVEAANKRLLELKEQIKLTNSQIGELQPWGDFAPSCLDRLAEAGRQARFYTTANMPEALPANAFIINKEKKNCWFISIDPVDGEAPSYPFATEQHLPQMSLSEAQRTLENLKVEQEKLTASLQDIANRQMADIEAAAQEERASVSFRHVQLGTGKAAEDTLMVMTGWVPVDNEQAVAAMLEKSEAWFEISMPTRNDCVPTLMKNNKVTRLYEVLTNMYGTPDYDEFDSTPMIAIFFSLFFGFCVGDAGYGLVLLTLGFPICKFLKDKLQLCINPTLVTVLGGASLVVGLLLGTGFGVDLTTLDWMSWLHPYMITGKIGVAADGSGGYDAQMVLALGIGLFHVCLAMLVKAIGSTIRFGFRTALVDWSWWLLIVGAVAIGMMMMLTNIPQDTLKYTLMGIGIVCGIGIYLLNDPNRNVGLNIGAGLWATYNMATGLMGDVLSYIRLYALGLAGGMLGGVFNSLASDIGEGGGVSIVPMVLILLFGHILNIAMSCLSAFVHPLRLTFVEYFKNSGYNGKGVAYKPFKK